MAAAFDAIRANERTICPVIFSIQYFIKEGITYSQIYKMIEMKTEPLTLISSLLQSKPP